MSVKYAIKELLIRRHRTIINCIGIAAAIALIISLYSLSNAYKSAIKTPFEESGIDLVLEKPKTQNENDTKTNGVILPDSSTAISGNEVQKLMEIDGIESIATTIQAWSFDKGNFKVIVGIDPDSPKIGSVMFVDWIKDGRFFNSDEKGVAVLDKHYAKSYGLKINDEIEVSGEMFKIVGTVETKEGSQLSTPNLFLPIDEVRRLTGIETGDVNTIYIRLNSATDTKSITDKISKEIPEIKITSPDSSLSTVDSLFSLSERFILLISIIIIVVGVFLILKTVSSTILERTNEIGIMKTVGWTSKNIRIQLIIEMLMQSIIGGILGTIIGIITSLSLSMLKVSAILPWQGSPIPGSSESNAINLISLKVNIDPLFIILVFITSITIALLCSLITTKRITNIKPAETLRTI